MSLQTLNLSPAVREYLLEHSLRESATLTELRHNTAKLPTAIMQISPEQGQFMALLIKMLGAKKTIDIGTYTGYSALVVAEALPPEGTVITCDVSTEFTTIAKEHWAKAGVAKKIDLRIAPAIDTLRALAVNEANSFDFIFIDADKVAYKEYYEASLELLRPGGLIAVDNVLQAGRVADLKEQDKRTTAIREFNNHLLKDKRVFISMVPISDGLTLALKNN